MPNKKLIEVMTCLDRGQLTQFHHLLVGSCFTSRYSAQKLGIFLSRTIDFMSQNMDLIEQKMKLTEEFFPESNYNSNVKNPVDSIASELFRLLKQYLRILQKGLNEDPIADNFAILDFYREQGMEERFWQTVNLLRSQIDSLEIRDEYYYKHRFKIETKVAAFMSEFNTQKNDGNLMNLVKVFDTYYLMQRLELSSIHKINNILDPSQNEKDYFEDYFETILEKSKNIEIPIVNIFNSIFKTLLKRIAIEEGILEIEASLVKYKGQISANTLTTIYSALRHLYLSSSDYLSKVDNPSQFSYNLLKSHYESGYICYNNKLHITTMNALIGYSVIYNELDFAKKVIKENPESKIIGITQKNDFIKLQKAMVYFQEKKIDEAHDLIFNISLENIALSFNLELLLIKIYFSQKSELFDFKIKSFLQKIRRSKMNPLLRTKYTSFANKVDQVYNYSMLKDRTKLIKIRKEIELNTKIAAKAWLLSEIDAVLNLPEKSKKR